MVIAVFASSAQAQDAILQLYVVHFSTGPSWNDALPANEQTAFAEHSANLNRLRREGIIQFGARYGEFGMVFLQAESLSAAATIIENDPGVQANIFVFQIDELNVFYPWQN